MFLPPPVNPLATSLLAGTQQARALQPQPATQQLTRRPTIPSNNSGKSREFNPRDERLVEDARRGLSKFDVSI